jgi:hypothetical protein
MEILHQYYHYFVIATLTHKFGSVGTILVLLGFLIADSVGLELLMIC